MTGFNVFLSAIPLYEGVVDNSGDAQASVGYNMLRDALKGSDFMLPAAGNTLLEAYQLKSASMTTRASDDREDLAKILNNMAIVYMASDRLPEALGALLEAEGLYSKLRPRNNWAHGGIAHNIGVVYELHGQRDKASNYYAAASALGYP